MTWPIYCFVSFIHTEMAHTLQILLDRQRLIGHIKSAMPKLLMAWWSKERLGISSHGIVLNFPAYSGFRVTHQLLYFLNWLDIALGWVGLWGCLWWAPLAKRKDQHRFSSGWSNVWHRSNTSLSSTQYEQIPIILGVWPFWLTLFFFRSITFWRAYGWIVFPLLK